MFLALFRRTRYIGRGQNGLLSGHSRSTSVLLHYIQAQPQPQQQQLQQQQYQQQHQYQQQQQRMQIIDENAVIGILV